MLWANGLHKGDAAVLPRFLLSGEVGVGQTYAVSKAITIPRLKKRMAEWERERILFFLNLGAHFVLADMCDAVICP